jgi:hypothetical protein
MRGRGDRNRSVRKKRRKNREKDARRRGYELGLDVAGNLLDVDREEIAEGNDLARELGVGSRNSYNDLTTKFTEEVRRYHPKDDEYRPAEENVSLKRERYAAASTVHRSRSPRARRVDDRRKAPITTDLDQWASNPNRWDYPGVDTPGGRSDFSGDKTRSRAEEAMAVFEEASQGARRIALGDLDGSLLGGGR